MAAKEDSFNLDLVNGINFARKVVENLNIHVCESKRMCVFNVLLTMVYVVYNEDIEIPTKWFY